MTDSLPPASLRDALAHFASGVPVVAASSESRPVEIAASARRRHATHDRDDHDILVGEVRSALACPGQPFLYYRRRFGGFTVRDDAQSIAPPVLGRVREGKA